MILSQESSTKL